MKYCEKCKSLISEETLSCPECGKTLVKAENESIICLATVKGRAISLLEPALKDEGVPCAFENAEGETYNTFNVAVSAESDFILLIPFEYYTRAFNVCLGMGIVEEEDRLIEAFDEDNDTKAVETYEETFERVNGVKKRTWTVIWVILFIVLACIAVWGVDAVAYLIKSGCVGNTVPTEAVKSFISLF